MGIQTYSNGFGIIISETEARIQFLLKTPTVDENAAIIGEDSQVVADIILNPSMLKQLSESLQRTIEMHEAKTGDIPLPKNVEKNNG